MSHAGPARICNRAYDIAAGRLGKGRCRVKGSDGSS